MKKVVIEKNRIKRAWIWLWYNDVTRFCVIAGVPIIPITAATCAFFGPGEYLRNVSACAYLAIFLWACIDNDYSNLRRIGLNEYRKKLHQRTSN